MEEGYIKICLLSELQEGRGKRIYMDEHPLAVFLVKGRVYVTDNICPHQHSNILHEGFLEQGFVVCPSHGWSFSLETGMQPDGRRGITSYPVHVSHGVIYAKFIPKKYSW
ncbi:MAG: Rieske 2Fe-2S domain-containing protein [Ignavibacteriaceae bacterium]|nr:Rieske 2Fe-2S domain-containing protein [Ignavibacteriaceae bacterium]